MRIDENVFAGNIPVLIHQGCGERCEGEFTVTAWADTCKKKPLFCGYKYRCPRCNNEYIYEYDMFNASAPDVRDHLKKNMRETETFVLMDQTYLDDRDEKMHGEARRLGALATEIKSLCLSVAGRFVGEKELAGLVARLGVEGYDPATLDHKAMLLGLRPISGGYVLPEA